MKLLEGKHAIVTGGSRGIGKGIVEAFCRHGADVVFSYLSSEEKALAMQAELEQAHGTRVIPIRSDAASMDDAEHLVQTAIKEFGTVEVLVNNAGITQDNLMMRMTADQWEKVISVNLNSVFNTTKSIMRQMLKQRQGSIINLSSVVGGKGNAGQANYAASKAGINGFTKSIALELGSRSIRCNAIAPGFIKTEMTEVLDPEMVQGWVKDIPLKRAGETTDIADVAVFLASDMSVYVTGQVLNVCGGMLT